MRVDWRHRLGTLLAAAAASIALCGQVDSIAALPGELVMQPGTIRTFPAVAGMEAELDDGGDGVARLDDDGDGRLRLDAIDEGSARVSYRLLGLLPVRTVNVSVGGKRRLIPGGQSVGIAIGTRGVIVVGASDLGGEPSPARLAGLRNGDIIQRVNGVEIDSAGALSRSIESGDTVKLDILRKGEACTCSVTPALDRRDGNWRLGAWVRDSTAGVGTLTFVDPETGVYGALGHAITDADTSVVMPVGRGELYSDRVVSITPSESGHPGELAGDFVFNAQSMGSVELNSERGVFGRLDDEGGAVGSAIPVASRNEIHTGMASLLTTLGDDGVKEYACEIVRVNERHAGERALVVRITDPALIDRTGGIVQGMSGSPILQDGSLAGAVTHVMVNDPTMGYGIAIEDMLEAAEGVRTDSGNKAA